jgi:RNA polymerase sigma-70 factor (ECF subfamily)
MVAEAERSGKRRLYELRLQLAAEIDPLRSKGADMQNVLMQCTRQAIGEIESLN